MSNGRRLPVLLSLFVFVHPGILFSAETGNSIPAFPGAEGFGAYARGGRGGRVIAVTTLADRGKGSLRAAVQAKGPRIVIFRVAGTIELQRPLDIREPFLTLAGQSAPGDGICLKHFGVRVRDTRDVIIRHLRIRPGAEADKEGDALLIHRSQNVIVDHCSLSWSVDEALDISDDWHEPIDGPKTDNITVQWCIISESLNRGHVKGEHAFAALISAIRDGDVTLHHNLFAHHLTRIPRPGGRRGTAGLRLEFRHNVIHDWGSPFAGYSSDSETASVLRLSYTDNLLQPGPSTPPKGRRVAFAAAPPTRVYFSGNRLVGFPEADANNALLFKPVGRVQRLGQPIRGPLFNAESAGVARERVLSLSGAIRPRRDPVDQRVVRQVRQGAGGIINVPAEVGGWPTLKTETALTDRDKDGMPDVWERQYALNPEAASDAGDDSDADGYTNIEEYLNATDPKQPETFDSTAHR